MFKIVGNAEESEHTDVLHKLIKQFMPYSQEKLGFDKPVTIDLLSDPDNAQNPLGKTAHYDPNMMKVTLFIDKRHVKDILRSLSHEMVHHTQNCQGEFDAGMDMGPGYAQDNEHLRNQEKRAYLLGNIHFRDWEDGIKMQQQENKQMRSKKLVNEMKRVIREEIQELEEGYGGAWYDPFNVAGGGNIPRRKVTADPKTGMAHGGEAYPRGGVERAATTFDIFNIAGGDDPLHKGEVRLPKGRPDMSARDQLKQAAGLEEDISLDEEQGELDEEYQLFEKTLDEYLGAGMHPDEFNENSDADSLEEAQLDEDEEDNPFRTGKSVGEKKAGEVPVGGKLGKKLPAGKKPAEEETNENIAEGAAGDKKWKIKHKDAEGKEITITIIADASAYKDPRQRRDAEAKAKRSYDRRNKKKKNLDEQTEENWFKGNKDQLLFEELTRKWAK